ncbi:hypothetical protein [Magnetospirillum sp. SS-4]|uniref:hypothetical protein n=1 Tax=Magnetospirillum sp. SS-4 TaxID=2681465 RepID=UPI001383067B|nr:hypothetical protein [Magnetospirillum sp. SS-4]CAA7627756.1 conserved exported hypothetical protein [Magnetospirillum sp. SS-4]
MRRLAVVILGTALLAGMPAGAADEDPPSGPALYQPVPSAAVPALPAEETPGFQAVRPVSAPEAEAPMPSVSQVPSPSPPVAATAPSPVVTPAAVSPPSPPPPSSSSLLSGPLEIPLLLAAVVAALMLVLGAAIAGHVGTAMANTQVRRDQAQRRQAAATILILELEARRQAFEAVPVPPNAEAGVSFVSAVLALAGMDHGWRTAQPSLHLLPEKLAGHLMVHYSAVNHVASFVKGLSVANALRMLQTSRIGGHPCPEPAAMREAHVELAAAFRGLDKLIVGLKGTG